MIKSGCLDSLGDRNQLLANLEKILRFVQEINKNGDNGQNSLFDDAPQIKLSNLTLAQAEPLDKKQRLNWEREYLGLYVSEHPMFEFSQKISRFVISCSTLKNCAPGAEVRLAGIITSVKRIYTKKGEPMVFATIEDSSGQVELLVFPKILEQNPHLWQVDSIIACAGKISDKDDEVKILCDRVSVLELDNIEEVFDRILKGSAARNGAGTNQPPSAEPEISITINEPIDYQLSKQLRDLFYQNPGNHRIQLLINRRSGVKQKIKTSFKVSQRDALIKQIKQLLGY